MNYQRPSLASEVRIAKEVVDRIIAAGIDPDDSDFTTLVESECDVVERIRRMLRAARYEATQADALATLIAEMRERKVRRENKAERLRSIAAWAMQEAELRRIEAPDFTASLAAGRSPVSISDADALPESLCRIKREPDKLAIRAALEAGQVVPGATLGNPYPILNVRTA